MEILGYKKLPKWLKERYIQEAGGHCQDCNNCNNLQVHRIKRGNKGGLYTLAPLKEKGSNVKVLCEDHHKLVHAREPGCRNR